MSLFKFVKYSSLLFVLGKYKSKLFRVVAVLLFAGITSLLYGDIVAYLEQTHPGTVIYALIGKIIIVYGALSFVLWQFRPEPDAAPGVDTPSSSAARGAQDNATLAELDTGPLSALENVKEKDRLRTRYDRILEKPQKEGE